MKINCECGSIILKNQMFRHLKTQKHINYLNSKTLNLVEMPKEIPDEIPKEIPKEIPVKDDKSETETEEETDNESEVEELVVEAKKKNSNKEHLDRIRARAHEVLKQKKMARIQEKIDKENELLNKARLYDELILKQKRDEEQRRLDELNRIEKEKEKRLKDYDRILEENMRLKASQESKNIIQKYAQEAIIDDLKKQRLDYLSKHLGINV